MLAIGATSRTDFRTVSVATLGADPKELRAKLEICLPRSTFADSGSIEAWIAESVASVRERMTPLLNFTHQQRLFLDDVIDEGRVRAELLDVSLELQQRIAAMPMLEWKCAHVRTHGGLA